MVMNKFERLISSEQELKDAASRTQLPQEDDYNPDDYLDNSSFKRMGIGLWLSENRPKIIKGFIVFLITISTFFFSFSIYNLVIYFKSGDPSKQIVENNLATGGQASLPELQVAPADIFVSGEKSDMAAKIVNPNEKFYAIFSYCFKAGDKELACDSDFIMPGEEKYVMVLGVEGGYGAASLHLSNVAWQKLDTKTISDYKAYSAARLGFIISDLSFLPASSGISKNIDLNWLEFSITNATPYGYYEMPLDILIFKSGNLVGVNRYILNDFASGAVKPVSMSWAGDLRGAKDVKVVPVANILDEKIFMKYKGEAGN